MGGCQSSPESQASHDIDRSITARKTKETDVKLLLLGAGDAGKTTFVKQMKIIHLSGYTDEEKKAFIPMIYSTLHSSAKCLIAAVDKFGLEYGSDTSRVAADTLKAIPASRGITLEHATVVKTFWEDTVVQDVYKRCDEYYLPDSTQYFFSELDRLLSPTFLPTVQDILFTRVRTTGVTETAFTAGRLNIRLVDVGGQRTERKKWIHCFEDVLAIIFIASLSEYDQTLFEDDSQNRMEEAISLFSEICASPWFEKTALILFLNKCDLFQQKFCVRHVPMKIFEDAPKEPWDYQEGTQYLVRKFQALNEKNRQLFVSLTHATDTTNIRTVFGSVMEILITRALYQFGITQE